MPKEKIVTLEHFPQLFLIFVRSILSPILLFFSVVGNCILAVGVYLFHYFEAPVNGKIHGWLDSIWWGVSTVTTVGYGDIVPQTVEGRVIGIILMIGGITFFVGFNALLVTVFFSKFEEEFLKSQKLTIIEYSEIIREVRNLAQQIRNLEKNQK